MKVKKRLQINIAVSVIAAFVVALTLFLAFSRISRAREESEIAGALLSSSFERSTFRSDYLRTRNERAKVQWFAKHEQIDRLLKSASGIFTDNEDKKNINAMIKDQEVTVKLFSDIVKNREGTREGSVSAELSREIENRLVSQLNMRLYEKVLRARALRESADRQSFSALRLLGWSIFFIVAAVTAAIINAWSMGRTITSRIGSLGDGASIIGEGALDCRIESKGDDEFAELAGTFNAMTAKLQGSFRNLESEIAERKRVEQERERLITELQRSNRELEQFAYVSSHDLQEPLRMVGSYVQLLARKYKGKLDEQADKYINYSVEGALRMQKLIEGLLAYSRISTRGADLRPVEMNEVFGSAVSNLAFSIQESRASVRKDDLPTVSGDPTQLMQLFQNLIGNAIKFRKPDVPPAVYVSARREGREWVFSVSDNGIGIKPEYFDRIFLIFQRLHTREEYPGTGLGLALCKRIVERHHGRIRVESTPGEGTTFYFSIPVIRGEGK